MRKTARWLSCMLVFASGCAMRAQSDPGTVQFARDVGVASRGDAITVAHRILALHRFEIFEEQDPPSLYIETEWLPRMPFTDEQGLGIEAAQTRVLVRGRPRNTTSALGAAYNVDVVVEQRVRLVGQTEWSHVSATRAAREHAARIAQDIRTELNVGVRKY